MNGLEELHKAMVAHYTELNNKVAFEPEYRVYYNKETGEADTQVVLDTPDAQPPEGDYVVVDTDINFKKGAMIINGRLKQPVSNTNYYSLIRSEQPTEYGTKKNNPYFTGEDDYYEYERRYK